MEIKSKEDVKKLMLEKTMYISEKLTTQFRGKLTT
jgi:hypothetical protein